MTRLKFEQIVEVDKNGNELKDREGNIVYLRNDQTALLQLLNAIDSKAAAVSEYKSWILLTDKIRDAWKLNKPEIELGIDEASFLKKILSNPQNDKISFSLFHVRTIDAVLEQLK